MLLDTCFFIDRAGERAGGVPGPCLAFLEQHRHGTKRVSVVSIGEFAVGASASDTLRVFRGYQPVSLGAATAIAAGRLQAGLKFELGENDLWIAATALRFGWPLVTRDAAFARVPGLKVVAY